MSRVRSSQYKPLLLSTTMRNPERMRPFLKVLKKFDGQVLTNTLCVEIVGELIRFGLYRPTKRVSGIFEKWNDDELLTDDEVTKLISDNPQDHKEAGFDKGWPSRFDTQFALMKRLGFVFYKIGELIRFSELGNRFIETVETGDEITYKFDEEFVFLNAFVKYHRKNPFQRVLNHNRPLVLLIQTIRELESRPGNDTPGISRRELPFLLVWKDADFKALADFIIAFRKKWSFSASDEVIFDACEAILGGWHVAKMKMHTVVSEEPDEALRKFRLTGLISLRGNGRFVAINSDKSHVVDYVLQEHSDMKTFSSEEDYFAFASEIDERLLSLAEVETVHDEETEAIHQMKWIDFFGEEAVRGELVNLARKRKSTDELLKLIPNPLRLEFLSTLLLKINSSASRVIGHYKSDDEGFPISHAPGNTPDIEVYDGDILKLVEVTLMTGRVQVHAEMIPIARHLRSKLGAHPNAKLLFIAPSIHADANEYAAFVDYSESLKIATQTIELFAAEAK